MAVWMVAVYECEKDLHEVVPDRVLRYWPIEFRRLFNDRREVAWARTLVAKNITRSHSIPPAMYSSHSLKTKSGPASIICP